MEAHDGIPVSVTDDFEAHSASQNQNMKSIYIDGTTEGVPAYAGGVLNSIGAVKQRYKVAILNK